jgi:perosamine synthetase
MGMIKLPKNSVKYFKDNIDEIFYSGNLAEGTWNEKLSTYTKNMVKSKSAIPTNSNGAGLVALLNYFNHYQKRNHVFIQTNTMYGVKTMVGAGSCRLAGYIDCQINTLMPSIENVIDSIDSYKGDKRNLIILLSHIGGIVNPDIEEIAEFCKIKNIVLLEDCAHSFGATLNGKHSGLFGDAGVYSFYATKAIPAGEGGIVVTNNSDLGNIISHYAMYDRFDQKLEIGNNIRISEIQALLTYSILKEWDSIIVDKKEVAKRYIEICLDNDIRYLDQDAENHCGNYYKFILLSEEDRDVNDFYSDIKTRTSPVYDYSIGKDNIVARHHICLPIWYNQDLEVTEQVCKELLQFKPS